VAVELGKHYNPNRVIVEAQKVMGIDPLGQLSIWYRSLVGS
jgi:hypothetical protein